MLNKKGAGPIKGFTLIEILIAIFILATVLTTVYAAYIGTFKLVKYTRSSDDIYSMARTAIDRMTEDMESVCKYGSSFEFVSGEIETGDFMELSFLSSSHLNFDDERSSGIAIINYSVVKGDAEDSHILKRRDELYRGEATEENEGGYILCDRLQSLTYKFYDGSEVEYDSWNSKSDLKAQKDKLPAVVFIRMDFINPNNRDKPYIFMTKVFLPMAENQ